MFLQSDEIFTHELKSLDHSLYIRITNKGEEQAPWRAEIFKEGKLIKFFGGYHSPEAARQKANEFARDSHQIFGVDWKKEELFHRQLMKKSPAWHINDLRIKP